METADNGAMIRRLFLVGLFGVLGLGLGFAQNFIPLKSLPDSLEIEVMNVAVSVEGTDEPFASYFFQSESGKHLSCVENRGTFRVRTIYESQGLIRIRIPKTHLIERIRITSALASISVKEISAVHTHILATRGDITVDECQFKTSLLTQNSGTLNFSAGIKSSALCLSNVEANVRYLGSKGEYHLDYSRVGSSLRINNTEITNIQGVYGVEKASKRALLSLSNTNATVSFP